MKEYRLSKQFLSSLTTDQMRVLVYCLNHRLYRVIGVKWTRLVIHYWVPNSDLIIKYV